MGIDISEEGIRFEVESETKIKEIAGHVFGACLITALMFHFIFSSDMRAIWLLLIFLFCTGLVTWIIRDALEISRTYVIFYPDKFLIRNFGPAQEYSYDQFAYFSIGEKYVYLHPRNKEHRKARFKADKEHESEWWSLLSSMHIPHQSTYEDQLRNAYKLKGDAFKESHKAQESRIAMIRNRTRIMNLGGYALAIWSFMSVHRSEAALIISLLYPLIALALIMDSHGRINVLPRRHSKKPSLVSAIFAPPAGLLLFTVLNYNFYDLSSLWIITLVLSPAIAILFFKAVKAEIKGFETTMRGEAYLVTLMFVLLYLPTNIATINCAFDQSEPEYYESIIVKKHISRSRGGETYLVDVLAWYDQKETLEISVGESRYNNYRVDEPVDIFEFSGYLGIPWFIVGGP